MTPDLDPRHFRYALAVNAYTASMGFDGRTLLTAADAQRIASIFALLSPLEIDNEAPEPGQVAATIQPPRDPRLDEIEKRLTEHLGRVDAI